MHSTEIDRKAEEDCLENADFILKDLSNEVCVSMSLCLRVCRVCVLVRD